MNPTDVVRTRIYNQPKEGKGLYKNGYDAYVKIVRHEGFLALYKGKRIHFLFLDPQFTQSYR